MYITTALPYTDTLDATKANYTLQKRWVSPLS